MSSVETPPPLPPHLHGNTFFPSPHTFSNHYATMTTRKRKHDDETEDIGVDRRGYRDSNSPSFVEDRMSTSPSNRSPTPSHHTLPRPVAGRAKRLRSSVSGRPLALPRLLETLDQEQLRTLLSSICNRHPEIGSEVTHSAPRPTVAAAISVLRDYEAKLQASFPFGGNKSSDYAYNRVQSSLNDLLDSLNDFTPHFLPPNETQPSASLSFLDEATNIIHRLPKWDSSAHNLHKSMAYEEISKAWMAVIKEASKRAAGMQLVNGGWDSKLARHNEQAGGRMKSAVIELSSRLGWIGGGGSGSNNMAMEANQMSIRQQILSGTYGTTSPARVGPW